MKFFGIATNIFLISIFASIVLYAQDPADITDLGGIATSQYEGVSDFGADKVIDNLATTRYLTSNSKAWIQYQGLGSYIVSSYSITSANNSPDRDPLNWTLTGSTDALQWDTLDTRSNEDFPERMQTRLFEFDNNNAYMYHRLEMSNNTGTMLHLAEWELFGIPVDEGAANPPASPSQLASIPAASYSVDLSWVDNAVNESVYRIDYSENNADWLPAVILPADSTSYTIDGLTMNTKYYFRAAAANSQGLSEFSNIDSCITLPPEMWQEHWYEHNQLVSRVFYDDDIAVYFDKDVNSSIKWPFSYLGDVWRYTKATYGGFPEGPRLYVVFHAKKYSGGHPFYYYDSDHDYRNGIDCGSLSSSAWMSSGTGNDLDLVTHEVSHVVESATFGSQGSPAFGSAIWGDSKWAEIFNYDVYVGLGKLDEAQRWKNIVSNQSDSYPRSGTYWFRDWFFPIWKDYGKSQVLANYFRLLSDYFPKSGARFTRSINWGEFVHFFSGAAGVSLKEQATIAFGWPDTYESQFVKAQSDFPAITYDIPTAVEDELIPGKYELHQNYPNPFNPVTRIYFSIPLESHVSLKVFDVLGQEVKSLFNESVKPGTYSVDFDGNELVSGTYFCRMQTADYHDTIKMLLVK